MKRRIADGTRSFSEIVTFLGDSEFADAELTVAKTNTDNRNKFIDYLVSGIIQLMPQGLVYYTISEGSIVIPPPPPPPPTGIAGPDNTGYRNAPGFPGGLSQFHGTIQSGQTYSFFDMGNGSVGDRDVPLVNVTFIGCRFSGSGDSTPLTLLYGDGFKFSYCSFEPGTSAPPVSHAQGYQYGIEADGGWYTHVGALEVDHCDMWGFANCIDVTGGTQAKPHIYRNNWIHDARNDGGQDHTDGIGALSGGGSESYLILDGNTIESAGNTNAVAYQGGHYDHVTVTNNVFGGFGYTINFTGTLSDFTFTDNTFSTRLPVYFGPLYSDHFVNSPNSTWARNKWHVPAGAAWGKPEHDGWFWMPVAADRNGSTDDTQFVSQTDHAG